MRGALAARLSPAFGRAMSARASLIAAVTGTTLLTGSAFAQGIALTNANLIDGSGAAMQPGVTIIIEGGRIVDMGLSVRAPAGSSVIDLTGKYVVPGIINGHGHVGPAPRDPQLRQYARYGVTTTGLLGSMVHFLLDQRPSPADRDHRLRNVLVAPLDQSGPKFAERFGVEFHKRYVGKLLKTLGFSHISARPRHPAQDERIVEAFKKTSRAR